MSEAIDSAQNNPDIRCLVITGGSGVFTAGNDLEDFLKDGTANSDAPRKSNAIKFLYSLAHNAKPIVAAVDGIAIGDRHHHAVPLRLRASPPPRRPSRRPSSISAWCRKAPPAC